ncbi:hypothetical protein MUK42_27481 [Musa troglodytarum]|uniref:Uncharacterized protein n=1 Tax=Musa troglodytarum TaxID=320322 RepID=A0A9E7JPQ2_9LILI|nr:hypothetical protein MUK42_27481 [Musa troglodytarum]
MQQSWSLNNLQNLNLNPFYTGNNSSLCGFRFCDGVRVARASSTELYAIRHAPSLTFLLCIIVNLYDQKFKLFDGLISHLKKLCCLYSIAEFVIINLLSRIQIAFNLRKQRQLNLVNLTSKHADSFNKTAASAYP